MNERSGLKLKILIVGLAILLIGGFHCAMRASLDPVALSVLPEVPKQGAPIVVTFYLNNTSLQPSTMTYEFYANGKLIESGATTVASLNSKKYQYVYENTVEIGEQLNFVVKTNSAGGGDYEEIVSTPIYHPHIWSSFISFASFSTSVMSSMSSLAYYQSSFGPSTGLKAGIIVARIKNMARDQILYKKSPEDATLLLHLWARFGSSDETNQYLTRSFQSKKENVIEFLKCYLPSSTGLEPDSPHGGKFNRIHYDSVAKVVNPDNVYKALKTLYGTRLDAMTRKEATASPENMITYQFIRIHFIAISEMEKVDETKIPYSQARFN